MDREWVYEIRVEGNLTGGWADWFEGLTICNDRDGETLLSGPITDQAALIGVLIKIQTLNMSLISVQRKG